jgi:2-iminoacetate synthase ThiH
MWIPELKSDVNLPIIPVGLLTTTTYCWAGCAFCRLAIPLPKVRLADAPAGLSLAHLSARGVDLNQASQIRLRGGLSLREPFDYWIHFLRRLRSQYTGRLIAFSPVEIWQYHLLERRSLRELVQLLQWAGVDLLGPGGSETWSHELRKRWSPHRLEPHEWFQVAHAAHQAGLGFSVAPIIGSHMREADWDEYLAVVLRYGPQEIEVKPLRSEDTRWAVHDSASILETAAAIHHFRVAAKSLPLYVCWDEKPLDDAAEIFAAAGADGLLTSVWEVAPA